VIERISASGTLRNSITDFRVSPLAIPEEVMRALKITLLLLAGMAFTTPVFAQGTGGGASAGGGTGTGGAAPGASNPSTTTAPIQAPAPSTGQTNPGVNPGAPGPSTAKTPSGISPTVRQPGYASSDRQPRAEDVPQNDTSSTDAIKELDEQLKRKLSICRGC
jgi:hypothetical protein